jgi:L-alanine-DL-glutamate epimerase-like enolase superfamily enzyme
VLVRVETDEGITGIGESMTPHAPQAVVDVLEQSRPVCVGQPVFDVSRLMASLYQLLGGALRDSIEYFDFLQGETPEELAVDAAAERYRNNTASGDGP